MKPAVLLLSFVLALAVHAQDADPLAPIRAQVKNPDAMFTLIVEFRLKPGHEREFRQTAQEGVRQTRQEPGNAAYEVHQDVKDPNTFVFFEKWRSMKALEDHVATPYTAALLAKAEQMSAAPMSVRVLTPFVPQAARPGDGKAETKTPDAKPGGKEAAAPLKP